jgi:alpha-glucosidase
MKATLSLLFLLVLPAVTVSQWESIGALESYSAAAPNALTLQAANARVTITFLSADVCRIECLPHGQRVFPDSSWAVVPGEQPQITAAITDAPAEIRFSTTRLSVAITKRPMRLMFRDSLGNVLNEDDPARGMAWCGNEVRIWKKMPPDEIYFGFGEKAGTFNRHGSHMSMWNSDIPGYDAATDPLYVTVPFFYALRQGKTHGVFFDNSFRSSFDMGKELRDGYSFGADGGPLRYYFFAGPTPREVAQRFTTLVGRIPLPPLWSLGYQQCRWSYSPESRVRDIARLFRANSIPCDVIYLDIDYMDGYRIFTWSPKNFPDPPRLINDLQQQGFHIAVIVDPGIKSDTNYAAFRSGLAGHHFVRQAGGEIFFGDVWPGRCAFPDFARAATRTWWGDQFAGLAAAGVRGWWNDMNEPSVFNVPTKTIDLNAVHDADGKTIPHAAFHNVYGMMMTRGTYEGVQRALPGERPFVLTRASFAGGERYAAVWTGDNVASWEHLRMALSMSLNLSVSGFAFVGSDIGGFIGYPSGELFARWLQLGVFTPLMRAHSVINEKNKEPWEYGPAFTDINRRTINLRYQFLPYIYTVMHEASVTGIPAMRPVAFDFPETPGDVDAPSEFLFGDHLLVAPVLAEGQRKRDVQLPPGDWYELASGRRLKGKISVEAPLDRLPLFAQGGSTLPIQQIVQYTSERPLNPLTFLVFPSADGKPTRSSYYEDDGHSLNYKEGVYFERFLTQSRRGDTLTLAISAAKGSYSPPERTLLVEFAGTDSLVHGVRLNAISLPRRALSGPAGNSAEWFFDPIRGGVTISLRDRKEEMVLDLIK